MLQNDATAPYDPGRIPFTSKDGRDNHFREDKGSNKTLFESCFNN